MPKRLRFTRRKNVAITEDAYRRLRRLASETDLSEGEALSFVFEHLDSVMDPSRFKSKIRQFTTRLEAQKR